MITFIIEILFHGICGWMGNAAIKFITLGKVDLDYGEPLDSMIAEWIGIGILLALVMLISFFINATQNDTSSILMQSTCATLS